MNKSVKYPIEAFALAMVLCSSGMKPAMVVGIGLIFGDVLQAVLFENAGKAYAQSISGVGALLTGAAMYGMMFLCGIDMEVKTIAAIAAASMLLMVHQERRGNMAPEENLDYNQMLLADSVVYGLYVLLAALREYFGEAKIFEFEFEKVTAVSHAYDKTMLALIGAGIALAIANAILKSESAKNAGIWACLPVIIIDPAFVLNNVPEIVGMLVGIAMIAVLFLSVRKKLVFSETGKSCKGAPCELLILGMMYMIFSIL